MFASLKFDKQRIYGLDILRAFAILFVVIEHGKFLLPVNYFPNKYFFMFKLSLDGVAIFFVLSGYLIGGILIKILEKEKAGFSTLRNFWIKRWFRTLPNYFLILILLLLTINLNEIINSTGVYKYFFFIQNFVSIHPNFFNEAWSLSIEEWFYLIMPILTFSIIALLKVQPKNAILTVSVLLLIVPILFRFYRFSTIEVNSIEVWDQMFRKQVLTRLDSLMVGVIGAHINYYYNFLWLKRVRLFFSIGIFMLVGQKIIEVFQLANWGIYTCVFSFSVNSIGTLFLLPLLTTIKNGYGIIYKTLTFISLISYSMYLLNLSVIQYSIIDRLQMTQLSPVSLYLIKYFLFWLLTILCSFFLYSFYEKPMMNLRNKFRIGPRKKVKIVSVKKT